MKIGDKYIGIDSEGNQVYKADVRKDFFLAIYDLNDTFVAFGHVGVDGYFVIVNTNGEHIYKALNFSEKNIISVFDINTSNHLYTFKLE